MEYMKKRVRNKCIQIYARNKGFSELWNFWNKKEAEGIWIFMIG